MLPFFGSPEKNNKIFHVAGTKGKGSVSILISYLLKLLNFKTTTFLSPHLINLNERFLYDLAEITNEELIYFTTRIKDILDKYRLIPTTFELLFLLYLLFSRVKKTDYLVIETGIGGRLDCTNVVDPCLSVITPISYDHLNILGDTLKKIAFEKAGIIKENRLAVISNQKSECRKVFFDTAKLKNAELQEVKKHFKLLHVRPHQKGSIFTFKFNDILFDDIYISLMGEHQIYNFFTAFLAVYLIHPEIMDRINNIKKIEVSIAGRVQLLQEKIPVILDVAHNRDSANKLKKTLLKNYPDKKWIVLSSMSKDKDYEGFYKELKRISESVIITEPKILKNRNRKRYIKQQDR